MDEIDTIKNRIDIVDLLSEHLELKKAGRNFKAICPFHNEKSPSFVVSPERQIWHCFGCNKGGDIFTFLEEYEKMDFSQSLKTLADRAGVKLSGPIFKSQKEEKKAKIYNLNSLAAQFYNFLLLDHPIGKNAKDYLTKKREIPEPLIKKFNLGFAPANNTVLTRYLITKKKHTQQDLVDAGLVTQYNGRTVDFFKERIIFPIADARDNILAFSGRALRDGVEPKYINTRETLAYKKSESLFGIQFAKEAMRKEGKVLLVEGEFDVITAVKEGIPNIVAVKGTALTEDQIQLIKRYVEKVLICFDTDPAGTAAQKRSITLLEKAKLLASVVVPPHGKDPDELLRQNPGEFKAAVKKSINIYDYIIDIALDQNSPDTMEGKRQILQNTLPFLSPIENEVIKEHYLKKLAEKIDSSYDSLVQEAAKVGKPYAPQPKNEERKKVKISREEMIENYMLSLLLQSPQPIENLNLLENEPVENMIAIPSIERIITKLLETVKNKNELSIKEFAQKLPKELIETFDTCYLAPIPVFENKEEYEKELKRTIKEAKSLTIKKRLVEIADQIEQKERKGVEDGLENSSQNSIPFPDY